MSERIHTGESGVVDQNVEFSESVVDGVHQAVEFAPPAHVCRIRHRRPAGLRLDLGGGGLTPAGYGYRSIAWIVERALELQGLPQERRAALREEFMDLCDHMNLDAILEPLKS